MTASAGAAAHVRSAASAQRLKRSAVKFFVFVVNRGRREKRLKEEVSGELAVAIIFTGVDACNATERKNTTT